MKIKVKVMLQYCSRVGIGLRLRFKLKKVVLEFE